MSAPDFRVPSGHRTKLRESRLADLLWQRLLHEKVHEAKLVRISFDLVVVGLTGQDPTNWIRWWPLSGLKETPPGI